MRSLFLVVGLLLVAILVGSWIAPEHTVVAREIEISASPSEVYEFVSDFERWSEWSVLFSDSGPNQVDVAWGEQRRGAGAQVELDFDGKARSLMTILDADPETGVWIETRTGRDKDDLWAGDGFRSGDEIALEESDDGCRVTWTRRGGPVDSLFVRLLDAVVTRRAVASQLEDELSSLRGVLEGS